MKSKQIEELKKIIGESFYLVSFNDKGYIEIGQKIGTQRLFVVLKTVSKRFDTEVSAIKKVAKKKVTKKTK